MTTSAATRANEADSLKENKIYLGRAENLIRKLKPGSIALSFWSPPYFVGKEYEKDATYESWQKLLCDVIAGHHDALKPGGFMVVNIADILRCKDEKTPRFQAMNINQHRSKVTREMVLEAKAKYPDDNRDWLSAVLAFR